MINIVAVVEKKSTRRVTIFAVYKNISFMNSFSENTFKKRFPDGHCGLPILSEYQELLCHYVVYLARTASITLYLKKNTIVQVQHVSVYNMLHFVCTECFQHG